jgi:hypothetical protein
LSFIIKGMSATTEAVQQSEKDEIKDLTSNDISNLVALAFQFQKPGQLEKHYNKELKDLDVLKIATEHAKRSPTE